MGCRAVLLDRDGTLIAECHYLSDQNRVQLLPGVVEGLRRLQGLGLQLVVVTNQSAVGRGYLDLSGLAAINDRLGRLLAEHGVNLDGIYVCPHLPDDRCRCRKPEPGLVHQAAGELHFDPKASFVIGDKDSDLELGRRLGATTILAVTGYGRETLATGQVRPDFVATNLVEAADLIARLVEADPSQGP